MQKNGALFIALHISCAYTPPGATLYCRFFNRIGLFAFDNKGLKTMRNSGTLHASIGSGDYRA
jgi:hypothetical protein